MNAVLDTLLPYAGRRTDTGETALMLAAQHGNVAAVKLLSTIEYGMQDNQGKQHYDTRWKQITMILRLS